MIKYIGMDEEEQRNLDRWRNMHDLHRLSDGELVFNPCWVWTEVNIAGDVTSSKPDKSALWPMSVDVIHVLEAIDGFKTVRMCYSVTLGLFIAYQLCVKSTHAICRQNAGVDADSQNVIPHFDLPPRHYCSRLCPTNPPLFRLILYLIAIISDNGGNRSLGMPSETHLTRDGDPKILSYHLMICN
jgi:hypothetical protein